MFTPQPFSSGLYQRPVRSALKVLASARALAGGPSGAAAASVEAKAIEPRTSLDRRMASPYDFVPCSGRRVARREMAPQPKERDERRTLAPPSHRGMARHLRHAAHV